MIAGLKTTSKPSVREELCGPGLTLTDAFALYGYTHKPGGHGVYRRRIFDFRGTHIGDMDAKEGWDWLRARGLYPEREAGQ